MYNSLFNLFDKYLNVEFNKISDSYNLIIELIEIFSVKDYVNNVLFDNELCNNFAHYDRLNRNLMFNQNIMINNFYENKVYNLYVYILHEFIHIMQEKWLNEAKCIESNEYLILKHSRLLYQYDLILPLYEYQAYFNSNYILFEYLHNCKCVVGSDFEKSKKTILYLLWNNYYNSLCEFESPLSQTSKKIHLNLNNDLRSIFNSLKIWM